MAEYLIQDATLTDIANSIRRATGTKHEIYTDDMPSMIDSIKQSVQHRCCVFDYDGAILFDEYLAEGETFTMPLEPSHKRLEFDGWSSPVDIVDNVVTVGKSDINIGALYHTASDLTEIDVELNERTGLIVNLALLTGVTGVDWGDGQSDNLRTHTYANYGEYTISLSGLTAISAGSSSSGIGGAAQWYVRKVLFSNSVESFGKYAFSNCKGLLGIAYSNSVSTIGEYAFHGCQSLKCVSIPNNVTTINTRTFNACSCLQYVALTQSLSTIAAYAFYSSVNSLVSITIPENVATIGDYAFNGCRSLQDIYIPHNATVGQYCFQDCSSLKCAVVGSDCIIKSYAFYRCSNLTQATFIGASTITNAFNACSALETITFGGPVNATGVAYNCYALSSITFPDGSVINGNGNNGAVYGSPNIQRLVFPSATTTVSERMVQGCCALKSIVFLGNITSVGTKAFSDCHSLEELDFTACTSVSTLVNSDAFTWVASSATTGNPFVKVLVPASLYDEWIAAANWSDVASLIVAV